MKAVSYLSVVWVLVALAGASAVAQQSQSTYLRWAASSDAAANPSLTYNVYRASS
jgi:hypothetical protein